MDEPYEIEQPYVAEPFAGLVSPERALSAAKRMYRESTGHRHDAWNEVTVELLKSQPMAQSSGNGFVLDRVYLPVRPELTA